jgi:hypothetical protein
MFFIIVAISLIVLIFCFTKYMKNWWNDDDNIIIELVGIAAFLVLFISVFILGINYSNIFDTVSTDTKQYDIVEFNKSTLINNSNESYIITYKTKDNNEFKISADNDTSIVIDNDNPTKVTVNEELKYSEWFFAHKKTITYTFQ